MPAASAALQCPVLMGVRPTDSPSSSLRGRRREHLCVSEQQTERERHCVVGGRGRRGRALQSEARKKTERVSELRESARERATEKLFFLCSISIQGLLISRASQTSSRTDHGLPGPCSMPVALNCLFEYFDESSDFKRINFTGPVRFRPVKA